jgi:hypothetical protein
MRPSGAVRRHGFIQPAVLNGSPSSGQVHQCLVSSRSLGTTPPFMGVELHIFCVGPENPCLPFVAEGNIENLPEAFLWTPGKYWGHYLDALGEIAEHPVCRSDEIVALLGILAAVGEVKNA